MRNVKTGTDRPIEGRIKVTRKGQATIPAFLREKLGALSGGEVAYRVTGRGIVLERVDRDHVDPDVGRFLGLIDNDIALGRNVGNLPDDVLRTMAEILRDYGPVDLDAELEGDTAL